jgi:hypothetical protein
MGGTEVPGLLFGYMKPGKMNIVCLHRKEGANVAECSAYQELVLKAEKTLSFINCGTQGSLLKEEH